MIRRAVRILAIGFGMLLLLSAVLAGVVFGPVSGGGTPIWLGVIVGLVVAAVSLAKLLLSPGGDGFGADPWTEGGAIVDEPPEATPETDPISGTELAGIIDAAARDARAEETVDAGMASVRGPLRETLVAVLQQGGWADASIQEALATGSWTDDSVAAAVLDDTVRPPERSLRHRLWAWLFPEKAVRRRTARAVGAIASAADAALPIVVGQDAPRPVPVVEPTVDDLQRATDGSLRRAVEGRASVGADEFDRNGPEEGETVTAREETDAQAAAGLESDNPAPTPDGERSGATAWGEE